MKNITINVNALVNNSDSDMPIIELLPDKSKYYLYINGERVKTSKIEVVFDKVSNRIARTKDRK